MKRQIFLAFLLLIPCAGAWAFKKPNNRLTPGVLCTADDPNFMGYYYAEHVARCQRNVSASTKAEVAAEYGDIPRSQWSNYEFDHLIPLCAGGSDDIENLWPQPHAEALKKDAIEDHVCAGLRAGTMTQREAVREVHDWFLSLPDDVLQFE